jgi:AcrR family transcriptional regulator
MTAQTPHIDRRTARTRRALRAALIALLEHKRFEEITVQEIVETADVARSSFYLHCAGKEDLLRQGLRTLREEIRAEVERSGPNADGLAFSRPLLEHARQHRNLFPALRGRAGEVFQAEMRAMIADLTENSLGPVRTGEAPREIVVQYLVGAFVGLFGWWAERNATLPPAELDRMFQRLAATGLSGLR